MKQKEVAIAFIENSKWELLLQDRRSISKAWEQWWFFGWWIESFEAPLDAIIRELKEELNLEITEEEIDYLGMSHWNTITYKDWSVWKVRNYSFRIKKNLDLKTLEVLEWDWAAYMSLSEYKKHIKFDMDKEAIMFYEAKYM